MDQLHDLLQAVRVNNSANFLTGLLVKKFDLWAGAILHLFLEYYNNNNNLYFYIKILNYL